MPQRGFMILRVWSSPGRLPFCGLNDLSQRGFPISG